MANAGAAPPGKTRIGRTTETTTTACARWPGARRVEVTMRDQASPVRRMLRGGSWFYDARSVRCAPRHADVPGYRFALFGFRPVARARGKP